MSELVRAVRKREGGVGEGSGEHEELLRRHSASLGVALPVGAAKSRDSRISPSASWFPPCR